MSKERTIRKSRRLAAKRRAEREARPDRMSVGEALGLSPRKRKGRNLAEAKALEGAEAAAAKHVRASEGEPEAATGAPTDA